MPVSEKAVVGRIQRYIRSLPRSTARKVHGSHMGQAGEPDIDACVDGRAVKLEVKAPGRENELTDIQKKRLADWEKAGALVGCVTHEDQVAELLARAGFDSSAGRWVPRRVEPLGRHIEWPDPYEKETPPWRS